MDGVEINPIIARDVMLNRFRDYSGSIYANPRVSIHVDDGRSFVRRSPSKYDVIQASLVDTWAATAAGAYTLTENSLYTREAFGEYVDHLTDAGILTITRWVFDGLRLVSLAQEACAERGLDPATRLAIVRFDRVATFMLKKSPFTEAEVAHLQQLAADLDFTILYAPGLPAADTGDEAVEMQRSGTSADDYRRLILAPDRQQFAASYPLDISATTDDRPFFFHTTRLRDQFQTAFGRSMLFGNGLSALLTLFGISALLVLLFVVGPLLVSGSRPGAGWAPWLVYFAALGAGFMLLEVAVLQRFVLLLGHPVYSLTVTLFSLLLGTGVGSLVSRRIETRRVQTATVRALIAIVVATVGAIFALPALIDVAIPASLAHANRDRGRRARSARRAARHGASRWHATAVRHPPGHRRLGLGDQRRLLGRRRDAGRLHRHELGLLGHATYRQRRVCDGCRHAGNALTTADLKGRPLQCGVRLQAELTIHDSRFMIRHGRFA